MRILTVVGARPQFIKAAAVSRPLRKSHAEILVHTGQHYDKDMSQRFFDELQIPKPDYNLGVGSGSHGAQTADMLKGIESVLLSQKPDAVMVYGDTNSTLAGALAASKLLIPVVHVEAGLRSYNRAMPEEQNRVLTDHIASLLLCPTETAVSNLQKEGVIRGVYNIGDVMCDAVHYYAARLDDAALAATEARLVPLFGGAGPRLNEGWYLATTHRAENTSPEKLSAILDALGALDKPAILPLHPRMHCLAESLVRERSYDNIHFIAPIGYLDMLLLTKGAEGVITDSGGLQKECYILQTPCVTVREQTEWVETLVGGWNILAQPDAADILEKCKREVRRDMHSDYYGDGRAAEKLIAALENL